MKRTQPSLPFAIIMLFCILAPVAVTRAEPGDLRVEPTAIVLNHPRRPFSLVVNTTTADGLTIDLSRKATYESADVKIATVDANGWMKPVANGKTQITVSVDGKSKLVD